MTATTYNTKESPELIEAARRERDARHRLICSCGNGTGHHARSGATEANDGLVALLKADPNATETPLGGWRVSRA